MLQEINLYPLLPQQQKSFLTLKLMAVSYSIFLLFLALSFCFELWGHHEEQVKQVELKQQLTRIHERLAQIKNQYPMLDPNDMESSVKKLQEELAAKHNIVNLLSHNQTFSAYLLGIAKAAASGMWLVDIQLSFNEGRVSLDGYAVYSSAVEAFMNQLSLQKEFTGLNFQLQEVTSVEDKDSKEPKESLLKFTIANKATAAK